MKLIRFGDKGKEKPGILDADGGLRDASQLVPDWRGDFLGDESLARARAALADLPLAAEPSPRLGAPVGAVGKIVGIGLNYRAHAAESGLQPPTDPILFLLSPTAINGPCDDIVLPPGSQETDWEVELAVVIGKDGRRIAPADALSLSPVTASPTMFRSANISCGAARNGRKAKAPTLSRRSALGLRRATRFPIRKNSRSNCRSTARRCNAATLPT